MKNSYLKKSMLFVSAAVLITILIFAQKKDTTPLALRWEKVEQLAEKQLPESALKEVDAILSLAKAENNTTQIIIATIYKMRFTLEIDPDKAPELIREFEAFANKETAADKKALLLSMTAELYAQQYLSSSRKINRRTQLVGSIPENLKEWSKNIYADKITNLLAISLQNADILKNTDVLTYESLLNKGDDSRLFQPTLFDFLAYRRINILNEISQATDVINPLDNENYYANASEFVRLKQDTTFNNSVENQTIETYQLLIDYHLKSNNSQALIFADLNRLNYLRSKNQNDTLYLKALEQLEEKYASNEFVVEILHEKASYYIEKNDESDENNTLKRKAFDICSDGIKRFPKYKRIDLLKNIQKQITQKTLNVAHSELIKPNTNLAVKISAANINQLEMKVYRINASAQIYYEFRQNRKTHKANYPNRSLVETRTIKLPVNPNFEAIDTTFQLKAGDYGLYEVAIQPTSNASKEEISNTVFVVSDLGYMQRINVVNIKNLYVLDRQSGIPQSGVQVKAFQSKWNGNGYNLVLKNTTKTDKNGQCKLPFTNNYSDNIIFLERGKDVYFSSASYSYYNDNKPFENENAQLNLFTDRSLYRPGQTVHFKGIAYYATKNRNEVQKSASYEVILYDANYQKISSKSFKTNEYGSFAGEFILPEGGLNGEYRLQSDNVTQTIYVEEYKRPTFEVTIDKPKTEVRFGTKTTLNGNVKAYAGFNIGDAKVKYRVIRTSHRYCWWWNEPETEIATGNTLTDGNGKFEVSFIPEKPKTTNETWRGSFYTYTLTADVTDTKGETQTGEQYISVGDKSLFIVASLPDKVERTSGLKIDIATETLNGEKLESVVEYEIYRLEELSDYIENQNDISKTKNAEKMTAGKIFTKDKTLTIDVKNWKSAQYRIILKTNDAFGNEVKTENVVIIYDKADKRPAVKTYKWLLTPKAECIDDEKAHIRFGTSTKNTAVLYEIMQGNKIIESKWLKFSDEIRDFEIPFKKEYGTGVTVLFTFMKDEKLFSEQVQITRKVTEKKLTPTLRVFRDKLLPGEKAEWTVTIPETTNDKKPAELLVGMYDASLDAIRPHSWNFNPVYREQHIISPIWNSHNRNLSNDYVYFDYNQAEVVDFKFDNLNWFGLTMQKANYQNIRIAGAQRMQKPIALESSSALDETIVVGYSTQKQMDASGKVAETNTVATIKLESKPKIRTNFNETAFFYPQLRTDAQGNVKFSFTAPESLTRWNVKMLAHSSDLFYGFADAHVVTQKDLMVQMNLPRFVRRSDKLVLSANVINLTDKKLTTIVNFELINPATEKSILLKDNQPKKVTLRANETKAVNWEVTEFMPYELVICKVVATAANFSDGEQKYLPVLPNKVLITENLPLIIRNNQTRTFKFESLLKNGSKVDTKNLSVEFTTNPAWYAVQALPTLSSPESNNALDYLTAYYSNSLAAFIANSNPKIAKVFDQWRNAKGSREALLSNLQKNAELKNMLLEETPWVLAAQNETEQKRQIALLFDLNMQKNQAQQYLDKLLKLQTPNGGFTWYEGMPESRYMTQEILLNLARLERLTKTDKQQATDDRKLNMVNRALLYLDLEIARDFAQLKKNNKKYLTENCVGNMQLFYLHLRSEYPDVPVHVSAQEAVRYYTTQSEKYWTSFTLYGKAMMAIVAHRNGKIQTSNLILKSLKENALKTDELGIYWARNTSGHYWNERPIAVQAAIIEAFTLINPTDLTQSQPVNSSDIDEMKIWLLKQKQTQRWNSPISTVNAIYALLLQGSDWLSNEGNVTIQLGKKTLQPVTTEAGTGYFKETIPVTDVKPEMGKITVSTVGSAISSIGSAASTRTPNSNDTKIGWGAMYWQYYQDLEKVNAKGGALKISKKLFVKNQNNSMLPIEEAQLKKGDKVITRLVISTDRNLEFVALKDLRAACFEPSEQRSGYVWKEGTGYFQTTKDASTQFFFDYLPKGTYVFEYDLWVNNSGSYTSGVASVQCQYAPEFVSHTGGQKIIITQ